MQERLLDPDNFDPADINTILGDLYQAHRETLDTIGGMGGIVPIGGSVPYGGEEDPEGGVWLIEDGRELSRTDYSFLFQAIGTSFGSGDGSSTFNIPDLRNAIVRGADGNVGVTGGDHTHDHNGATGQPSSTQAREAGSNANVPGTNHTHSIPSENNWPPWVAKNWIIRVR